MKKYLIYFLVFLAGVMFAPRTKTETKIVPDLEREKQWLQLKEIDDKGFLLTQEGFGYCADFSEAVSRLDVDDMKIAGDNVEKLTPKIKQVSSERETVLKMLGL